MKLTRCILLFLWVVMLSSQTQAHVRLLLRNSNWHYTPHYCFICLPPSGVTASTGMGRGATELRVGGGDVTFRHD